MLQFLRQVRQKENIPCRDKTIKARDLGNINSATLEFDDEEISDYIEERSGRKQFENKAK